jgi:CheY-like chemotaxis protein
MTEYILLIEDNDDDLTLMRRVLSRATGISDVQICTRLADALTFLAEHHDAPPALVLLDLRLPDGNGLRVLETVKNDPDLKQIPVVVLTSSDAPEDRRASALGHANIFITKPGNAAEFEALMEALTNFWIGTVIRAPARRSRTE